MLFEFDEKIVLILKNLLKKKQGFTFYKKIMAKYLFGVKILQKGDKQRG